MYETHPSLSSALLLPSLVFSLGKICKNLWSLCQCSDCPCLSLFYPSSTSSPQHSRTRQLLHCCTSTSYPRLFKWKPPYFPALPSSSSLPLLTLLHCSSSQLSFPAVCLGTASSSSSSSSHSSHPSLTFVWEPPASGFPLTHAHTPLLCPPSPPHSLFQPVLRTNILCSHTIPHQTETLFAANFSFFNAAGHVVEFLGLIFKHTSSRQLKNSYTRRCNC